MSFTDMPDLGAMLLVMNGRSATTPRVPCSTCGRALLRVYTTAGARAANPRLPQHRDCCITTDWKNLGPIKVPCPMAVQSKGVIDELLEAARR